MDLILNKKNKHFSVCVFRKWVGIIYLIGRPQWPLHFDFVSPLNRAEDNQPYLTLPFNDHKITSAVWGPLGEFVIAGHENGEINQISAKVKHHAEAEVAEVARGSM